MLVERGERGEALALVDSRPGHFAAEALAARLRLEDAPEADPRVREAFAALDAGERKRGLDLLLDAIGESDDGQRDDLRRAIVGELDQLGADDPLAREYRRRLAAALY
jgi:putative thioredoxin